MCCRRPPSIPPGGGGLSRPWVGGHRTPPGLKKKLGSPEDGSKEAPSRRRRHFFLSALGPFDALPTVEPFSLDSVPLAAPRHFPCKNGLADCGGGALWDDDSLTMPAGEDNCGGDDRGAKDEGAVVAGVDDWNRRRQWWW